MKDLVKGENIGKKLVALSDVINGESLIEDNEATIYFRAGQVMGLLTDGSVEELDIAKDTIDGMRVKYSTEIEALSGTDTSFLESQVKACNTAMGLLDGFLNDGSIDISSYCNLSDGADCYM